MRIGEAVVRHRRSRIVDTRVAQPCPQPFGFHFVADAGQFRTDIAAHHISSGVLHGVAGGAERLAIQTGCGRRIGRLLSLRNRRSVSGSGVLLEIKKAEISRASGSLNLKFGMVAVTA